MRGARSVALPARAAVRVLLLAVNAHLVVVGRQSASNQRAARDTGEGFARTSAKSPRIAVGCRAGARDHARKFYRRPLRTQPVRAIVPRACRSAGRHAAARGQGRCRRSNRSANPSSIALASTSSAWSLRPRRAYPQAERLYQVTPRTPGGIPSSSAVSYVRTASSLRLSWSCASASWPYTGLWRIPPAIAAASSRAASSHCRVPRRTWPSPIVTVGSSDPSASARSNAAPASGNRRSSASTRPWWAWASASSGCCAIHGPSRSAARCGWWP